MDERIRGQVDTKWTVEYGDRERKRLEQQASLSQKSPTLSIRHFLREHGALIVVLTVVLTGIVVIPNIGSWGNINLREGAASMQSRIQSGDYQVDPQQALGSFAIQNSAEVPLYILRSTRDLLSQPNPDLDNKSPLQILEELGYQPKEPENIWDKRIIVTGLEGHSVASVPIPATGEAYEKYKKYINKIIIGKLKRDIYRNSFAILPLLDPQKGLVQFILLTDPIYSEEEVGGYEPLWMPLALGYKDGKIKYDSGVSTNSPELDRILQRLLANAFSDQ